MVTNLIYLSPQFPRNYIQFLLRLPKYGVSSLGIGSDYFHELPEELRAVLTEYYRVSSLDDLQQVLRAGRYFREKYGEISRVESHTEYFLPLEALLREDLGVWGKSQAEVQVCQQKSLMKERFRQAGVNVPRGQLVEDLQAARSFVAEVGYPIILKPDKGVGASRTLEVTNNADLERFFADRPPCPYFAEEFVVGEMETFDGLTNHEGEVVYYNSLKYERGIMEVVNENTHVYYYTAREIPEDLQSAGRRTVQAFDVREKFFHLEFFRRPDGQLLGLEVNIRPPGGLTTDMWNYADDIDLYEEWARGIAQNRFSANFCHRYHVAYVSRKDHLAYAHTFDQVFRECASQLRHWERLSPLFRDALGDTGFILRSASLEELMDKIAYIHQLK